MSFFDEALSVVKSIVQGPQAEYFGGGPGSTSLPNPAQFLSDLTPEAASALDSAKRKVTSAKTCLQVFGKDVYCREKASTDAAKKELEMLVHDIWKFRRSNSLCLRMFFNNDAPKTFSKSDKIVSEDVQLAVRLMHYKGTSQPAMRGARIALDGAIFFCSTQ